MNTYHPGDSAPQPAAMALVPARHPEIVDCWNSVGVYGDRTCPELQSAIHCRNCRVYSRAGLQLLNRSVTDDYRREWSEHLARQKQLSAHTNASAVVFRIQSDWLALPTRIFQEIAEHRLIHSVPHARRSVLLGLANVRGELLICVHLGQLLGLQPSRPPREVRNSYRRLLVLNPGGERFALPVDEVHGACRFNLHDLKAPPATVSKSHRSYTAGFLSGGQRSAAFLRADLVFSDLRRSLVET